jgi:hypothetical protein
MKSGDIMRIKQLGQAGHVFVDPAYVEIVTESYSLIRIMVSARDAEMMKARNYLLTETHGYHTPRENLSAVTEDEANVARAVRALCPDKIAII